MEAIGGLTTVHANTTRNIVNTILKDKTNVWTIIEIETLMPNVSENNGVGFKTGSFYSCGISSVNATKDNDIDSAVTNESANSILRASYIRTTLRSSLLIDNPEYIPRILGVVHVSKTLGGKNAVFIRSPLCSETFRYYTVDIDVLDGFGQKISFIFQSTLIELTATFSLVISAFFATISAYSTVTAIAAVLGGSIAVVAIVFVIVAVVIFAVIFFIAKGINQIVSVVFGSGEAILSFHREEIEVKGATLPDQTFQVNPFFLAAKTLTTVFTNTNAKDLQVMPFLPETQDIGI